MRIAVISDLHGRLPPIPKCDVLILGGDICPDIDRVGWVPELMKQRQMEWLATEYFEWEQCVPTNNIWATPGNHDWVSTFPSACRSRMFIDQGMELNGKTFWFTPWVAHCGQWNYQLSRGQRAERFKDIPEKLDVLVMHSPAFDVGDLTYTNETVGCRELRRVILEKKPRYAVFGHIHEGQRFVGAYPNGRECVESKNLREFRLGETTLFHASMWGPTWTPVIIDL